MFPLFRNDPARAQRFALDYADACGERDFFIECVFWTVRDGDSREEAAMAAAKATLALLKGLDPAVERAKEVRRNELMSINGDIGWAFDEKDFAKARKLVHDNLTKLDDETAGDIVLH